MYCLANKTNFFGRFYTIKGASEKDECISEIKHKELKAFFLTRTLDCYIIVHSYNFADLASFSTLMQMKKAQLSYSHIFFNQ